jgi:hypothetical protein
MKYKRIVTLDFETFFSQDYSLKLTKYNTSEYVRDQQFKIHCVSIKIDDDDVRIYYGDTVEDGIRDIDWSTSALLAHNTAFDGLILSHHFGVVPAYYLDTLSMARAVHSNSIRAGLDYVAKFYGVGNKIPDVLDKTKGLVDLPYSILTALGLYCATDVELCYDIFQRMRPQFSDAEMDLIDLTIRMFCDPVLLVDIPRAELALKKELDDRADLIAKTGLTEKQLRSSAKLAKALLDLGVQPPTKTSPRTGKLAFAFAKGDLDFQELLTNPDDKVRDLVAARMAAKSTIEETRAIRFIQAGSFGRPLPVGYSYFGAHTSRWSGNNKCLDGDTEIIVRRAGQVLYIMLSSLLPQDLVWDGQEFVSHKGLIDQGIKEVIAYAGITGTPDHRVYIENQEKPQRLDQALSSGLSLRIGSLPCGVDSVTKIMPSSKRSLR